MIACHSGRTPVVNESSVPDAAVVTDDSDDDADSNMHSNVQGKHSQ